MYVAFRARLGLAKAVGAVWPEGEEIDLVSDLGRETEEACRVGGVLVDHVACRLIGLCG